VLLPLRAFLGFTFCFAGLQKLATPGFFDGANPASIQAQLTGAARRSPIHAFVSPLVHVAVPLGVLIALAELAVGLGTLVGLWTRAAAVGGALVSFMLFLTISFHSNPYYTGSDIVFVFAWLPLVLTGSAGVLSADAILTNRMRRRIGAEASAVVPIPFAAVRRVCGFYEDGRCKARRDEPCEPAPCPYLVQRPGQARRLAENEIDRRTFALKGVAAGGMAVVGLLGAGAVAGLGRLAGGTSNKLGTRTLGDGAGAGSESITGPTGTSVAGSHAGSRPPPSARSPTSATGTGSAHPAGTRIGPARDVPVGSAASFQDPNTGDPALVVQPQAGRFLAFDAVCPHAGCTVQYDTTGKLFVCPCHGSEFNGATGAVEVGPATAGLSHIGISEGRDGQLYVI
jgi:thiosulfate dehydrogenase [quinone] large subunit